MHSFFSFPMKNSDREERKSFSRRKASEHRRFPPNGPCFLTAVKEFLLYELVAFILAFNLFILPHWTFPSCCLCFIGVEKRLNNLRRLLVLGCLQNKAFKPLKTLNAKEWTSSLLTLSLMHFNNKNSIKIQSKKIKAPRGYFGSTFLRSRFEHFCFLFR